MGEACKDASPPNFDREFELEFQGVTGLHKHP